MKHTMIGSFILVCLSWAISAFAAEWPAAIHYGRVVELGLPVSGVVDKVLVQEGQHLKRGDLMLELDETPFTAELQQARASLRRLQAERDEVRKALDRNLELYDRMVLPTVELDHSKLEYTRADSEVLSAQARVALAEYHFNGSKLKAPFDGRVIRSSAYPGMAVRVDLKPPVLFVYADTTRYTAVAEIPADKPTGLTPGDVVQVATGGRTYSGKVLNIVVTGEGQSLSQPSRLQLTVSIEQPGADLMPGMPATIRSTTGVEQ